MDIINISSLDLNLLKTFVVLMEERSVSRASERLNLSQSATSNALERIRESFGDSVMERDGREMVPTRAALALWPTISKTLLELENALISVRDADPSTMDDHFTIGIDEYAMELYGEALVKSINEIAPNVSLSFVFVNPASFTEQLNRNEVDLLVAPLWQAHADLVQKELFVEEFIGLMSSKHPLVGSKMTLKRYVSYSHILFSSRGIVEGNVDVGLKKHNLKRQVAVSVPWYNSAVKYLSNDRFLLSVGARLGQKLKQDYPVAQFKIPVAVPGFTVKMVWHPRNTTDRRHAWLRNTVESVFAGV